jgi:plasmid stability protein
MKNITLAVDEAVLSAVRKYAAAHNTSVNALVRDHLSRIASSEDRARSAIRELRAMSDRSSAELGRVSWTRDELHDR